MKLELSPLEADQRTQFQPYPALPRALHSDLTFADLNVLSAASLAVSGSSLVDGAARTGRPGRLGRSGATDARPTAWGQPWWMNGSRGAYFYLSPSIFLTLEPPVIRRGWMVGRYNLYHMAEEIRTFELFLFLTEFLVTFLQVTNKYYGRVNYGYK